ncbi:MAG: beta-lactamase family protein [Crocinitomicaceae bacterium]|nr:beta-lactamase family protein [Crocinitomicaceae bacterium]
MDMNPALAPSETLEHSITENELVETTKKYFDYLGKKDLISGTILLAKGDRILYLDSCGEASKRFHVPNNTNTKFNLGSMNKMFTGIAVVKLAQEGKLGFSDKLDKYVDESWLSKETASKVSIHQLLTHSSGLGDYFSDNYWNSSRELYRSLNDFKPLVEDTLYFEPGSSFQYSNTGMLLLGVVIEKVTGQSYFDYVKKNIYLPLGMINTDSYEMDAPVENLAIGYMRAGNEYGWMNNIFTHVLKGGPAGGGFSSVHDLHKFGVSLLKEEILDQKNLDILFDFHQELPESMAKGYRYSHYGYGFMMGKKDEKLNLGHLGGFPGISSGLNIEANSGYMIITLSNYDLWGAFLNLVIRDQIMRVKN